ncbi:hypothetical protein E2320_010423, partial [Naja naja]
PQFHPSFLTHYLVSILYADKAAITCICMYECLKALLFYCCREYLNINYFKAKFLAFSRESDLNLRVSLVIIKCTNKYGNNYVPEAIKLFEAKVLNLMLNSTQLCIFENTSNLETI